MKKTKNKLISLLLTLVMVLSLLPATTLAVEGTALTRTGGTLSTGSYYLSSDITLTNNITVNGEVTLDLNGYVLKGTGSGSVITVPYGAKLTIKDSNKDAVHKGTLSNDNCFWTWDGGNNTGTAEIKGGIITGGSAINGGGVYVQANATFTMTGGTVAGNKANSNNDDYGGGGVSVRDNATFTMTGGNICNNMAMNGGGLHLVKGSSFNMSGGNIYNNKANYQINSDGGGVCMNHATFVMSGGKIYDNEANREGGGVSVYDSTFTMSAGEISKNHATRGGGVSAYDDQNGASGTITITGGTITDNTAAENGGGVYYNGYSNHTVIITLGGTAEITENTVGAAANNVYLPNGKTITLGTGVDAPAEGMSVGVTMESGTGAFTTATASAGQEKYFFADNPKYYVNFDTNHLELKVPQSGKYAINVIPSEHGVVTASTSEAAKDSEVTLTVTPADGYRLKEGSLKANSSVITDNKFTMPAGNVTITAEFENILVSHYNNETCDSNYGKGILMGRQVKTDAPTVGRTIFGLTQEQLKEIGDKLVIVGFDGEKEVETTVDCAYTYFYNQNPNGENEMITAKNMGYAAFVIIEKDENGNTISGYGYYRLYNDSADDEINFMFDAMFKGPSNK